MNLRTKNEVTNETVLLDKGQAQILFNLGWMSIDRLATECGARVTVGRTVLYVRKKLEDYLTSLTV